MDQGKIAGPVAREIGVADAARSAAFYRDVLGFEIREANGGIEALSGPARVGFGPAGRVSILFFETDGVEELRAAIAARGGAPSEIEKVNWIKMRMFEVRDPDGNVLWFGQSYHEPDRARPRPMLEQALPEMPFDDVVAAVDYYQEVLGFHINYAQQDLGVMDRDDVTVLLITRTERHKGIGSFEVYVLNADALYAELKAKGVNVQGEPVSRPWGLREFEVLDCEGNRIRFAQRFE